MMNNLKVSTWTVFCFFFLNSVASCRLNDTYCLKQKGHLWAGPDNSFWIIFPSCECRSACAPPRCACVRVYVCHTAIIFPKASHLEKPLAHFHRGFSLFFPSEPVPRPPFALSASSPPRPIRLVPFALSSRLRGHLSILIPFMGERFARQSFPSKGLPSNAQSAEIEQHLSGGENPRTGRISNPTHQSVFLSIY